MGKINASYKIILENQKKRKYGNKRNFYINLQKSNKSFRHRIHSLLGRADARGSADIIAVSDAYR